MNLNGKLYVKLGCMFYYSLSQTYICYTYTHVKVRSKYIVTYPIFNDILQLLIIISTMI